MLQKLETLLTTLQQLQQSEALRDVVEFYGTYFSQPAGLKMQLTLIHSNKEQPLTDLQFVVAYLKSLSIAEKEFYSEVIKVVKLILVMPATNSVSERSFSAPCRLKKWLQTTTTHSRLNWCMLLHIHKERNDALSLTSVGNEFISRNESRACLFGQF